MRRCKYKLVYIAGPYRDKSAWEVEQNIREAEVAGLDIARMGAVPVVPHTMYRFYQGVLSDRFWLDATLEIMTACDAVYMLPSWESSIGATCERRYAKKIGIPVFEDKMTLSMFLGGDPAKQVARSYTKNRSDTDNRNHLSHRPAL